MKNLIINKQEIVVTTENNTKYVAIKPICAAIGIEYSRQLKKIKEDEILSSVMGLKPIVGADKKLRKMQTLPLKFVFGWLFTINQKNVNPEVKEDIVKYRLECYNALFENFTKRSNVLQQKRALINKVALLKEELKQDEKYLQIQDLKKAITGTTKHLNSLDKEEINQQPTLF